MIHIPLKYLRCRQTWLESPRSQNARQTSLGKSSKQIRKTDSTHQQTMFDDTIYIYGSVSKPCTPGEHQNSW